MSRRDILLAHIDRDGLGLEIGPSHNPIAPRRDGFRVEIVDHASREDLVVKYAEHGVDTDAIEEVDFVWDGRRRYVELTGRPKGYDWIIASHVIEHVPDLAAFINDCDAILRDGGVLSLAVPDKRYCFDRMRPLTSLQSVVDAHLESRTNHTPGRVADYFLNVVALDGRVAWSPGDAEPGPLSRLGFVHGIDDARRGMRAAIEGNVYLDIHAWCFTPSSFRLLMDDLYALGCIQLRETAFQDGGSEFFVAMSRNGAGHGLSRMELLDNIEHELSAIVMPHAPPYGG